MWLAFRLLSPKYPPTRAGLPIVRPQPFSQLAWLRCAGMLSYCLLMAVKVVEGVVGGIEYERGSARGEPGTPEEVWHATPCPGRAPRW